MQADKLQLERVQLDEVRVELPLNVSERQGHRLDGALNRVELAASDVDAVVSHRYC